MRPFAALTSLPAAEGIVHTSGERKWLESAHPSPLSAYRGFFGSRPFSSTNALLNEVGLPPIAWSNANVGEVDQADR